MMELKSLTPLAEFVDMLYTHGATDLTPIAGLRWWVELHPPAHDEGVTGAIKLKGTIDRHVIQQPCKFDAVTEGVANIDAESMSIVAEYHVATFKAMAESHGGHS